MSVFNAASRGAVALALLLSSVAVADAQRGAVRVDTPPLAVAGSRALAAHVQPLLARGIASAFAGSGASANFHIRQVTIASTAGDDSEGFGAGQRDYLSATVDIMRDGRVAQRIPMEVNQPAGISGGTWFLPKRDEDERVVGLGRALGEWTLRRMR
jgi:hypothetical protein